MRTTRTMSSCRARLPGSRDAIKLVIQVCPCALKPRIGKLMLSAPACIGAKLALYHPSRCGYEALGGHAQPQQDLLVQEAQAGGGQDPAARQLLDRRHGSFDLNEDDELENGFEM